MTDVQLGLFRRNDRLTSRLAAQSLDPDHITASQAAVLQLLRDNPRGLTDSEILYGLPRRVSPSRARTARAELVRAGRVRDTGTYRVTDYGRLATVWEVVP